jgi:hypothetical protein
LVGAVHSISRPVRKDEVKGIISLKTRNLEKTIEECITEVLNVTRTEIIKHYIFISGINPVIVQALKNTSIKNNENLNEFALSIISKKFPVNSVKNVKLYDDYIRISFTKEGRDYVSSYSNSNNLLRQDVINHIFTDVGLGK